MSVVRGQLLKKHSAKRMAHSVKGSGLKAQGWKSGKLLQDSTIPLCCHQSQAKLAPT